uniref:Histone deacetylase 12 n=1 Tax=Seriola lalandi dorsalis TaxID=1841481 RepID=A0A3B4WUW2_SERLL
GGTVLAAEVALQRGLACSTAGGTHHAFPSFGSGFCLLNDLAVAAKYLMGNSSPKRKVLIVDLDVHQGDGTAFIFKEETCVFTFSVHCGKNFPLRKQQSDLDISVEDGMEDKDYLSTEAHLPWLLETFRPDLVLYDAGVDPHWEDELGRLRLTDQGERELRTTISPHISRVFLFFNDSVSPRAVSERSVCDEDCGEQGRSCRCRYWRRIFKRHRQTGPQTLHRPQSS